MSVLLGKIIVHLFVKYYFFMVLRVCVSGAE
jgi:hypothetical protein